MVEIILLPEN